MQKTVGTLHNEAISAACMMQEQDAEGLAEYGTVYLAHGAYKECDEQHEHVGKIIYDTAVACDLPIQWVLHAHACSDTIISLRSVRRISHASRSVPKPVAAIKLRPAHLAICWLHVRHSDHAAASAASGTHQSRVVTLM
jgi:hypothetical protein